MVEGGLKYVYCFVACAERESLGGIGMGGSEVYTIPYKDISAVVSDVKGESASDPFGVVEMGEGNWLRHDEVVRRIMLDHTLIPVKFDSVLRSAYDVNNMLKGLYKECLEELRGFEGKVEMGVKVTWNRRNIEREIEEKKEIIRKVREGLCNVYYTMMRRRVDPLGDATKMVLDSVEGIPANRDEYLLKIHYAEEIYSSLKERALDARAHPLLSRDMILNGSFLAHKDRADFGKGLEEVKGTYEGRGFKFMHSAPFPPYSFTKIKYY